MILWIFLFLVVAFGLGRALHITWRAFLVIAGLAFVGAGILLATLTASSTAFWIGLGVAAVFFFFGFRRAKKLTPYERQLKAAQKVVKQPLKHSPEQVAVAQELLRQHEAHKEEEPPTFV